ncbi:MAG: hypothetical protein VX877_07325 [Planctomycetota bacterium]|nr:hypothetical protein [Planctomycetota bacterium]MEE3367580.1 hypothetical protein [Planctomycetota bacterium]
MNGANVDSTDAQLTTARARLASCREEIQRLRSMRRQRAWTRGRMNGELKLVLPLLRLREQIPDVFWRTFVLIIGTSLFVAIAFLATRQSSSTATAVTATAVVAGCLFTLLVLLPTDSLLDRRRLVLSQVAASADYEYQNVCSQLQFLIQRRDTIQSQLALLGQRPSQANPGHNPPAKSFEQFVDQIAPAENHASPDTTQQEPSS